MKVSYDPEVDIVRILLSDAPIVESDESKPGVIMDYDAQGHLVGLEVLDASHRLSVPRRVEVAIAAG